jgi:predicted PurR-regulated permease PerM
MAPKNNKESFLPPLWIITVTLLVSFLWIVSELKEIVVLLVIGYSIAYVLDPMLDWLERKKISRQIGFFIVVGILSLLAGLFFAFAVPPLLSEIQNTLSNATGIGDTIANRAESFIAWVNKYLPQDKHVSFSREQFIAYFQLIDSQTLKRIASAIGTFLLEGYSIGLTIINLLLLPLIVFYLSIDLDRFHKWFFNLVPKSSKKTFGNMVKEIDVLLRAFVVGQSTVCVILAVLYAIGFAIAGHSQWFLMGAVAGLGNIVPYLGSISGAVLGIVFSLTSDAPLWMLIKTAIVFTVVQALEGMVITPKVVGEKVGLSPLIVILAILIGGKLFGLLGIFLAVPVAATLSVAGGYAHRAIIKRSGDD